MSEIISHKNAFFDKKSTFLYKRMPKKAKNSKIEHLV